MKLNTDKPLAMQVTLHDEQINARNAGKLVNDFALLDAQSDVSALAKVQSNETSND